MLLLEKTEAVEMQIEISGITYTKEIGTSPSFPQCFQALYCCGWSFVLRPLRTLWSHWVAISCLSKRRKEGKLQEMSLLWAPQCWKEVGRRPNTSCTSLGPPSACSSCTSFPRASLLWETHSLTATELQSPRSLYGELDPITLSLAILPSAISTPDMAEPSPRKTPDLLDLCMKAPRAWSYPLLEIPVVKNKSSHKR